MTSYSITLLTGDGGTARLTCAPDETVKSAATRAGLTLPGSCGAGQCGGCAGQVEHGFYALDSCSLEALPALDRAAGKVLLCRTQPREDLVISVRQDLAMLAAPLSRRDATVEAVTPVGGRTIALRLQLIPTEEEGAAATFEPGQYYTLFSPDGAVQRAYSPSSLPNWDGSLEFLIRQHPQGAFSGQLDQQIVPGTVLSLTGPQGSFILQDRGLKPRWFIGGGTGLAPLLSMLRRMAEWQEPHPVRLYLGVNREEDLFAAEQLDSLQAEMPHLLIRRCVWQPGADWTGFQGTPAEALAQDLAAEPVQPDLYVCGPAPLVAAVEELATRLSLPPDSVIAERFLPG